MIIQKHMRFSNKLEAFSFYAELKNNIIIHSVAIKYDTKKSHHNKYIVEYLQYTGNHFHLCQNCKKVKTVCGKFDLHEWTCSKCYVKELSRLM